MSNRYSCPDPSRPAADVAIRRPAAGLAVFALLVLWLAVPAVSGAAPGDAAKALEPAGETAEEVPGIERDDSPECMRCHWMETMAYRDRDTRKIVDLSIDRDVYRHSVHADLACRDCHARGYKHYPHRTSSADEALHCVGCHAERGDDGAPDLTDISLEFQKSVHAIEASRPFDCFSCHNPHTFRPVEDGAPVEAVVATTNRLCLDCHTKLDTPVPKGHEWLPKPREHWASVRCIECHTPVEGRDMYQPSHALLGAPESNRNCVECHTQGSELLSQLYNYRAAEQREQEGFFAQALYNDAYIVGMSRSPLIDRIGLALAALMVLGVIAHGFGRYLAYRKQRASR
jgi:hypothetical protein